MKRKRMARTTYCEQCGTTHRPGECPMFDNPKSGRKSRAKNAPKGKSGDLILAAHKPDWELVDQRPFRGKFIYIYQCNVSGCGRTGNSERQGQKPFGDCPEKRQK